MESIKLGSPLPRNLPTNNRPGDINRGSPRETTAPALAKSGRDHVFDYEVLTHKEKILQNFLKQSRFPHDKDDPKLQGTLKTSIYFGTPIIQHAAHCIPVCRAVEKYLSMREIVTLACLSSNYRLLITTLIEKYYSHSPAIQANYRSRWQSDFITPPEQLTLWLNKYFDKSDKAWVEEDTLRQAALHRYLCNRVDTIKCVITTHPEHFGPTFSMATLPNGRLVSGTYGGYLKIWDLTRPEGKQCVTTLPGHSSSIFCVSALADEQIISGSSQLKVWDLTKPEGDQCVATLPGHSNLINCILMLPDARIISGSTDGYLKVWDLTRPEGEQCVTTLCGHTGWLNSIAMLTDRQIVSGSDDRTLRVWDLTKPEKKQCVAILHGHTDWVNRVLALAGGQIISCSADCTLRVWDLTRPEREQCVAILRGHTDGVNCVSVLSDGRIITGSRDHTLRVWDLTNPEGDRCVAILRGHTRGVDDIARFPGGQVITCSEDYTLKIWNPSAAIDLTRALLSDQSAGK